MRQRKASSRLRHASPAGLSIAKSADLLNVSATQQRPKQLLQSARRSVVVGNRLAGPAPADAGLDEVVDLAVEDAGRVAGLVQRAQVLDHLVRVQDVGAHLVAPRTLDVTPQRIQVGALLGLLQREQLG